MYVKFTFGRLPNGPQSSMLTDANPGQVEELCDTLESTVKEAVNSAMQEVVEGLKAPRQTQAPTRAGMDTKVADAL